MRKVISWGEVSVNKKEIKRKNVDTSGLSGYIFPTLPQTPDTRKIRTPDVAWPPIKMSGRVRNEFHPAPAWAGNSRTDGATPQKMASLTRPARRIAGAIKIAKKEGESCINNRYAGADTLRGPRGYG